MFEEGGILGVPECCSDEIVLKYFLRLICHSSTLNIRCGIT